MPATEGTVRKEEGFLYVAVPEPGKCETVNNSVEDLTAQMQEADIVASDDEEKDKENINPHLRTAEQARGAFSDPALPREMAARSDGPKHAMKEPNHGVLRGPRNERSLCPGNQRRRGASDANGRIPRTRDAIFDGSFAESADRKLKGRATGKGKAVSLDDENDESSSDDSDAGSDDLNAAHK